MQGGAQMPGEQVCPCLGPPGPGSGSLAGARLGSWPQALQAKGRAMLGILDVPAPATTPQRPKCPLFMQPPLEVTSPRQRGTPDALCQPCCPLSFCAGVAIAQELVNTVENLDEAAGDGKAGLCPLFLLF